MSTITPIGNRLLVRLDVPETVFSNGLIIPETAREQSPTGVVESVGTGEVHSVATTAGIDIQPGDRVLLASTHVGSESGVEGLIIVDIVEVLAVLA